jgi:phosphate:Na+ symporter
MVQTGIDRGWRPEITAALRWAKGTRRPAGIGLVFAIALQSATATGMLAAGFAAKGALTTTAGLAIMLGADLGSALVVYFLSLNFQILAPVLLIVGTGYSSSPRPASCARPGERLRGLA